jgi:hypothetical protein
MIDSNLANVFGQSFPLFFIAGWGIRTILLPYKIARRVGRKFKYGHIGPEERKTLTKGERRLLIAQKILAIFGLLAFVLCGFFSSDPWAKPPR